MIIPMIIKRWFNLPIVNPISTNVDQQGATAANRQWRPLPTTLFPVMTRLNSWMSSYLGCRWGPRLLLALVDCLCLVRKDWAGPDVEYLLRWCCCKAEVCKREKQMLGGGANHLTDTIVSMSKNLKKLHVILYKKIWFYLFRICINVSESVHLRVMSSPWFARWPGWLPPLLPVWWSWNHLADPVEENSLTQSCSFND